VESFLLSTITNIIKATAELEACGSTVRHSSAESTSTFAHGIHHAPTIVTPFLTVIASNILGVNVELVGNLLSNFIGSHHFVCPPFLFVVFSISQTIGFVNRNAVRHFN
jgi:hypothetical protein